MGINRIRLQDGAVVDPRMDARMQQTYQQNIAANQAQQARNEGIFQAARDKLQGFRNTLTEGVQAALNYGSIPANFAAGITGLPIGYTTQQMRDTMDAAARASTRRGPEGGMYVGYEDLGAQEGPGGEFLGMNKDMTSAQRALALTSGDVGHKIGTQADGAELSAADTDSLVDGVAALAIKKGIAMDAAMHVGLGGATAIAMVAGLAYDSSAREAHFTITSTQSDLAGAVICGIQFAYVA